MALIECPECGGKVSDKVPACIHCGYPLKESVEEKTQQIQFCPYCGKQNNIESTFCGYCGKSFVKEVVASIALSTQDSGPTDIMDFKKDVDKSIRTYQPQYDATQLQQIQIMQQQQQFEAQAKCPKCGSVSLSGSKQGFGIGKAVVGAALVGGVGLLAGGIGSNKTVVTCLNCGYKFKL